MSLFKSYTPKILYHYTLSMIDSIFVHPPTMDLTPTSYFKAVLDAHQWIKNDLEPSLAPLPPDEAPKTATLEQIHASLAVIEKMLFGSESTFEPTLEGCCLYTLFLEKRLRPSSTCSLQ